MTSYLVCRSISAHASAWLIILLGFFGITTHGQDFPPRANTLVTDFTNTLSESELQSLERKLVAFDDSTSTQMAVVIMRSTGNYEIADYSVQLFNQWKIGQAEKNNGILILVAREDRKVWITTGFGIEGVLPDVLAKRVIENDLLPNFRNGDYYAGIDKATNTIMSIVSGEFTAEDYLKKKDKPVLFPIFIFLFIVFVVIISQFRRVSRYAHRNNLAFWAAWALLNAAANRSRGSWGGFTGGGGFGGGGGGFGGFGGGGSGGGGAGGSW